MAFSLSGAKEQKYRLTEFGGGLNTKHNPETLSVNESPDLLNVVLNEKGLFRKRPGVKVNTLYPNKAGVSMKDAFDFQKRDGAYFSFAFFSDGTARIHATGYTGDLQLLKEGNPYTHGGHKWGTFYFQDKLYFGNRHDGWFRFDGGTSAVEVTTIPACDYAVVKNNRVYYGGELTQPDRLTYSHQGDPEDVTITTKAEETQENVGGVIDFVSDSLSITGLSVFQGDILVFKEDKVFNLSGDDYSDFSVKELNVATGNIARHGVTKGDNVVYYVSANGVYYIYSSDQNVVETVPLSDKISSEFGEVATTVRSVFHHGKLYLFFPTKTLVFDEMLKSWTRWDTKFTCSFRDEENHNILFGGYQGYLYTLTNELRDEWMPNDYKSIIAHYSTPYLSFDIPELTKRHKWAKIFYQPNTPLNALIDVEIWIDYSDQLKSINTTYDSLLWEDDSDDEEDNTWGDEYWGEMRRQMSKKLRFGGSGEFIKLVFKNAALDEELSISTIVFGFKLKNKVR